MFIDPHVHCRDGVQAHKETIAHALKVAEKAGFTAIFDMPNVQPPITTKELVLQRLALAEQANTPVFYGAYLGLTYDTTQVKQAVATYNEIKQVVGFKLYAGHSVGKIGVINEKDQQNIYQTLSQEGYEDVVILHCEKEALMSNEWDPQNPISHAYARPWQAEVASVKDQLQFAKEAGFKGRLHIAHTSVPETVRLVNEEKELKVTCGVCPHHLLLDYRAMQKPTIGLRMKMNPPLRSPEMKQELLELLKQKKIDWIETDHAPHTLKEKEEAPYMSGVTNLQKYPKFIAWLRTQEINDQHIKDITFNNIVKTFKLDLKPRECIPQLDLEKEYPFDPYAGFNVLD